MKAVSIDSPGHMSLVDIAQPVPGAGEVAVAVHYVGFCGSDLTSYRGLNPLVSYPRVPGHEISGVVLETGAGVAGLVAGQSVTILPYFNCGHCNACRMGRPNACKNNQTMGVQREGAMTGIVVVPEHKVIPVEGLDAHHLALIEPCAVGFHAVRRAAATRDETAVVLGCGMIGLGVVMGLVRQGVTVIAVDLSPEKLATARQLGATHTIAAGSSDVVAEVAALCGDDGPSVVIEAVGAEITFRQAIELVGSCGRVVYVGYAKHPVAYDTKQFLLKELDIRGSRGAERRDFDDVIAWFRDNPGLGTPIISRIVPLEAAGEAMAAWDKAPGDFTKILVEVAGAGA